MTVGIAVFATFRKSDSSTIVARYQSYWPGQTVDGHEFYPFNSAAIVSNSTGGQQSLSVTFAVSPAITSLVEAGLADGYLVELSFYSFALQVGESVPTVKTLFASYLGELINASQSEEAISIQIGSSLDPVEAQAPPRKFTTTLIGEPPKI
jgi:hypothetical protein